MCYAIPGKIIDIAGPIITVDYFGEKKKARNEFYSLSVGEYVYAQGGFVIQKIKEVDALPILEAWRELFFKLQDVDLRITRETKSLYGTANLLRRRKIGNSACVHGIIEFSNWCRNDCLYCGLRKSNASLTRYRMAEEEIIASAADAAERGFKALVLQSGEDIWYTSERLAYIIKTIMEKFPLLLVLSIGERESDEYKKLYEAGARGILLRFETSSPALYEKLRPGHILEDRINLIKELLNSGYLIFTGFLIGLPGQKEEDIRKDIELTHQLGAEMFSFGPFIPHPATPLAGNSPPSLDTVLQIIARTRILYPESKILVTTALETMDKTGARQGLLSGANSLMIDVTPQKYQRLYDLYPGRPGAEIGLTERIDEVTNLLYSLGRAPTDLGL